MHAKNVGAAVLTVCMAAGTARAQVPPDIEAGLRKIGQIVDPGCTAKLYRPLMPVNDYNTYWPPGASAPANLNPLYPGITIARDQPFGPNAKDVVDIFTADKGGDNRPVLIYVPGGAGNKIEQQAREANAFYDNIGRWAAKNGMVGVTVQRHPGAGNWDDGGRDISLAVDWLKANIKKFKGNPDRMFIWAHSAGNGPLGVYIGHPERWKNGVAVKGAVFMSGNPVPGLGGNPGGPPAGGGGRGAGAPAGAPAGGAAQGAGGPPAGGGGRGNALATSCGIAANAADGAISGPSGGATARCRCAGRARQPAGIQKDRREDHARESRARSGSLGSDDRRRYRAPRRTVQGGRAGGEGRRGSLPGDAVRAGREPHVRSVLDRHEGHDRLRANPGVDQESEVIGHR